MRKMLSNLLDGLRSLAAEAVNPEAWFVAAAVALTVFLTVIFFT